MTHGFFFLPLPNAKVCLFVEGVLGSYKQSRNLTFRAKHLVQPDKMFPLPATLLLYVDGKSTFFKSSVVQGYLNGADFH